MLVNRILSLKWLLNDWVNVQRFRTSENATRTISDPCAPSTSGNIADPADPDCVSFITCSNGVSLATTPCTGLRFNPTIQTCDHVYNVPCGGTPTTTTTTQTTTTTATATGINNFCLGQNINGVLAKRKPCMAYYSGYYFAPSLSVLSILQWMKCQHFLSPITWFVINLWFCTQKCHLVTQSKSILIN